MLCPNAVDFFFGLLVVVVVVMVVVVVVVVGWILAPSSGMLTFTLRWCNGGNRLRNGLRKLSINGWVGC